MATSNERLSNGDLDPGGDQYEDWQSQGGYGNNGHPLFYYPQPIYQPVPPFGYMAPYASTPPDIGHYLVQPDPNGFLRRPSSFHESPVPAGYPPTTPSMMSVSQYFTPYQSVYFAPPARLPAVLALDGPRSSSNSRSSKLSTSKSSKSSGDYAKIEVEDEV